MQDQKATFPAELGQTLLAVDQSNAAALAAAIDNCRTPDVIASGHVAPAGGVAPHVYPGARIT